MANAGAGDKCVGATAAMRASRVPDAVRHPSCRSAEPGPYHTPEFVTAPALQRTASQVLRHSATKTRVNALMALRPEHDAIRNHFGLSAAAFLQADMNFLRSLPW